MPRFVAPAGQEDHRIRVARQRRERTRLRLLDAVLSVYPGQGEGGPAVIDDVLLAAQVSRNTFYKYFPSLEQAVTDLANRLADDWAQSYAPVLQGFRDPLDRVANAMQMIFAKAADQPRWGAFIAHRSHLGGGDNPALHGMMANLAAGLDAGTFRFASMDAALDLTEGAMIEAIRRLIRQNHPADYIEHFTAMILQGLGVAPKIAARASANASAHLKDLQEQPPRAA